MLNEVKGWLFLIGLVLVVAVVRSCFFSSKVPVDKIFYTVGEVYHAGNFRGHTYVYYAYQYRNQIYTQEINSKFIGHELHPGDRTEKFLVVVSPEKPEYNYLLEEQRLPDSIPIGTALKSEDFAAIVKKNLGPDVGFDTLDKGKLDENRTKEYEDVKAKSRQP
jgi:hypothetical protein